MRNSWNEFFILSIAMKRFIWVLTSDKITHCYKWSFAVELMNLIKIYLEKKRKKILETQNFNLNHIKRVFKCFKFNYSSKVIFEKEKSYLWGLNFLTLNFKFSPIAYFQTKTKKTEIILIPSINEFDKDEKIKLGIPQNQWSEQVAR